MRKWSMKLFLCLMAAIMLTGFSCYVVADAGAGDLQRKIASGVYVPKVENFEVLVDTSASMADPYYGVKKIEIERFMVGKMNQAIPKIAVNGALRNFGFTKLFSDEGTKLLYGLTPYSKQAFNDAVQTIAIASNDTPLGSGINAASGDLSGARGRTALIIFSDWVGQGQATLKAANDMKSKFGDRICIYPVMIGNDKAGTKVMDSVALAGQCGFATNADDIATADSMENFVEKVFFTTAAGKCADSDNDGVCDYDDKCPNTPYGAKVYSNGCPVDSDGDGVPDYRDKCPNTPKGVKVDKDGCPPEEMKEAAPVKEAAPEVVSMTLMINFDTGKSYVRPRYYKEVKKVADFMKKYPDTKMEIQGHTDNVGKPANNKRLSQARANAVRNLLIKKYKVNAKRLTAVGYGPDKPVASNATKEGKAQNRRVQAVVQSTK